MLLAVVLHLACQHLLLSSVEVIAPVFFCAISFAEIQLQRVSETVFLDVVVGIDVEPVIVLIGADECTEGGIHIEVRLQIKVELAIRFDDLLTERKIQCREMSRRGDL